MKISFGKKKSVFIRRFGNMEKLSYLLTGQHVFSKLLNIGLSKLMSNFKWAGFLPYYPTQISIEPTIACNYRCLSCPHGMPLEDRKQVFHRDKFMSLEKYKKVIDSICGKTWYLSLTGIGESFLHPEIFEMIEYAANKGMFVTIETNASVMDPVRVAGLPIQSVHLALDCMSQESYGEYRIGGQIDVVRDNIIALCEEIEKSNSGMKLLIRYLINKYTEDEFEEAKSLVSKYDFVTLYKGNFIIPPPDFETFKVKPQATSVENYEKWKPVKDSNYDNYQLDPTTGLMRDRSYFNEFTGGCPGVYSGAYINSDGEMFPCCVAAPFTPKELSYGNVFEDDFGAVWNGKKARTFRRKYKAAAGNYGYCSECSSSKI
ncbi:radical SAM additional 4Fe4S-binding SPASM domain-containing protein [Maridesulfovibrio ferrireducens]|uniref:Radical SAM additional 4Fe4S-binding SPASM domain-containing protein n=1 Tax=Maridesulfovibrio ferrireducens TaxID=246191 RepID=A0A1G9CN20_9BACT|nr:radical SAM protein [Maridesulfovibrio ferrireducens]SDK53080.1 radical SAM additional 4Fe4S-binding SPASM domain-containing protein [Maridesulfovibrio ferrireducens]